MSSPADALIEYKSLDNALMDERRMFKRITSGSANHAGFAWSANRGLVVSRALSRSSCFTEASRQSEALGWPVYIRQTGGGVTPQGPGILNVSLAFTNTADNRLSIADSYRLLCNPIITELALVGVHACCAPVADSFCNGNYNVTVNGKKLAGTAQRWSRMQAQTRQQAILAHALLLYDTDLQEISAAVNRLYMLLKLEQRCDSAAHCDFISVYPQTYGKPIMADFGLRLLRSCHTLLEERENARAHPTIRGSLKPAQEIPMGNLSITETKNENDITDEPTPQDPSRRTVLQGIAGAAALGAMSAGVTANAETRAVEKKRKHHLLASSLIHNGRHEAFYGRATALWPFEYRMRQVAEAGFTGVGLLHWDLDHTFRFEARGSTMADKIRWMKGVLDDNGLVDVEIEFLTQWMHTKDDGRRQAEQPVRDMLMQMSAIMKPHHVKVGNFYTPVPVEQMKAKFKDLCRDFPDSVIAYEILTNDPNGGDVQTMIHIVEGNDNGGLFLDTWHTNNTRTWNPGSKGLSYDDIANLPKGLLKGVELDDGWFVEDMYKPHFGHISSVQFLEATIHSRCCLGEGNFDVVGFIRACSKAGFDGPWGNEIISENVSRYPIEMMLPHIYKTSLAHIRNALDGDEIPQLIRSDYS